MMLSWNMPHSEYRRRKRNIEEGSEKHSEQKCLSYSSPKCLSYLRSIHFTERQSWNILSLKILTDMWDTYFYWMTRNKKKIKYFMYWIHFNNIQMLIHWQFVMKSGPTCSPPWWLGEAIYIYVPCRIDLLVFDYLINFWFSIRLHKCTIFFFVFDEIFIY